MNLSEFRHIREQANAYLRRAEALWKAEGADGCEAVRTLRQMEEKLASDAFDVLVVGEFSSGKSTLLNGILGQKVLPTHISPTTATINILEYGEQPQAEVAWRSGKRQLVPLTQLIDTITSLTAEADARARKIEHVRIRYPSHFCQNGVRLVDTPGLNSTHEDHERATMTYLPRGSAGIMVISALQFLSKSQRDYLKCFRSYMGKMFFLVTMIDELDEDDDYEENEEYFRSALAEVLQRDAAEVKLYPVNAKAAEAGEREASGLQAFLQDFEAFLTQDELAQEMLAVPVQKAQQLLTQYKSRQLLQLEAVKVPYEMFESRLAEAQPQRAAIERERLQMQHRIENDSRECINHILHYMEQCYMELVQDAGDFVTGYHGDLEKTLPEDLQGYLKQRSVEFSQKVDAYTQREFESMARNLQIQLMGLQSLMTAYWQKLGIERAVSFQAGDLSVLSMGGGPIGVIQEVGLVSVVSTILGLLLGPIGVVIGAVASAWGVDSMQEILVRIGRQKKLAALAASVKDELLKHRGSCQNKLRSSLERGFSAWQQEIDGQYQKPLKVLEQTIAKIRAEKASAEAQAEGRRTALQANISAADKLMAEIRAMQ